MEQFQLKAQPPSLADFHGALRICRENPRYFANDAGKPVYLTGSHTWSNMQEYLGPDPDRIFDYPAYLDWMQEHGFNFMRGWIWEQASFDNFTAKKVCIGPHPYARTGPGYALDGELRFDLDTFNQAYFDRLRRRIIQAGERGIYVSVMLFNRWSMNTNRIDGAIPWNGHPFHKSNNINGLDGDPMGIGGRLIHTLTIPEVTKYQEAYIRKVIDTVQDLENVLFEIGNEHYEDSWPWQYHLVQFIHACEANNPLQHPVGITSGGGEPDAITNLQLWQSPADWIAPRDEKGMSYKYNPVAADGSKVILTDTDHLWGLGGTTGWVWQSLTRGLNPILMDPYEPVYGMENFGVEAWALVNNRDHPIWEPIRRNMGYAKIYADRIDLALAVPRPELASSGYCLAHYGDEYLVYFQDQRDVSIDLGDQSCQFSVEWLNPENGAGFRDNHLSTPNWNTLISPFADPAAVVYLKRLD